MASPTASPTAATTAITATVSASIAVTAAAKILARTIAAAASGIVLGGIVMGSKVLWRGSVGIGLAFLRTFGVLVIQGSGMSFVAMLLARFAFRGVSFVVRSVRLIGVVKFFRMEFFVVRFFVMLSGARQGFPWQQFDRRTVRRSQ